MFVSSILLAAAAAAQPHLLTEEESINAFQQQCGAAVKDSSPKIETNANKGVLLHLQVADGGGAGDKLPLASYMRLKIDYVPCNSTADRNYTAESRGWIKRFVARKKVAKILKVSATVKPLGVSAAKTLSSLSLDSGKSGEIWSTDVENDTILLPYFRFDPNASVNFEITFSSTRDYNSSIAGETLSVLKHAATLISPGSLLVTSQNKEQFNKSASFVDTTVDGLLKVAINENVHLDVPIKDVTSLATLTLYVPAGNDPYVTAKRPNRAIGQWRISVEPLLEDSIFWTSDDEKKDAKLSAAAIMNFQVSDEKTLKDALTGAPTVELTRDALLAGENGNVGDQALALCRATAIEADKLGFSHSDVGKASWAFITDLALPETKRETALSTCRNNLEFFWTGNIPIPADPTIPAEGKEASRGQLDGAKISERHK